MSTHTTTKWGLTAPNGNDPIRDGDDQIRALADELDDLLAPHDQGLLSARPVSTVGSPGLRGRTYRATDDLTGGPTGTVYLDYGTGWMAWGGNGTAPVGSVQDFAGASDPSTAWLLCDGRSLLRASYPTLFALVSTTYGSADGTHFNIPDARGRATIGAGTGPGLTARTLAATVGAETHQLTAAESGLPEHEHYVQGQQFTPGGGLSIPMAFNGVDSSFVSTYQLIGGAQSASDAHTSMQPSLVLNKIIRAL